MFLNVKITMAVENIIYAIGEVIGALINAALRLLGISEVKTEKIINGIAYSFLAFFILCLIFITFKYS